MLPKLLILDRDGVLNVERHDFVHSWDQFDWMPGSLEALAAVRRAGVKVVVVTNQSIVGRGGLAREEVDRINVRMRAEAEEAGGRIEAVYVCPHAPDEGCDCRKPGPGMVLEALKVFGARPDEALAIGDSRRDLEAASAAGVPSVLVRSGYGAGVTDGEIAALSPIHVAEDLASAVRWILDELAGGP